MPRHSQVRRAVAGFLAGVLLAASSGLATAQTAPNFPQRAVKLIVPFPPGGATDALARQIAEQLSARWKQPVVVDNKPGGNTILGTDAVAKAPADGYTLGIVTGNHSINPLLTNKLPYDTFRDLTGVMMLTRFQMLAYAHPSLPASTPAELIALAKKSPGSVAYATATTQSHLAVELMNVMAGTQMRYIPYKGSAQAMTDLLGGHIQLLIDPVAQGSLEHVKSGKLKLIGTLGTSPPPLAPNAAPIPAAVPGFEYSSAFGLVTRAGTPPDVVRHIRDEFAAVIRLPEVAARIRDIGQEPVASTPEEYNTFLASELKKWQPIVKSTGAKLE